MFKSILAPVDLGHPGSWERSLPVAIRMARVDNAELHILTVMPTFGLPMVNVTYFPDDFEERAMADTKTAMDDFIRDNVPGDIEVQSHVAHGTIYSEIIKAADVLGCDAIVLAAHRPGMQDYLIGPNAARVARHAKQSVFVVRNSE